MKQFFSGSASCSSLIYVIRKKSNQYDFYEREESWRGNGGNGRMYKKAVEFQP